MLGDRKEALGVGWCLGVAGRTGCWLLEVAGGVNCSEVNTPGGHGEQGGGVRMTVGDETAGGAGGGGVAGVGGTGDFAASTLHCRELVCA